MRCGFHLSEHDYFMTHGISITSLTICSIEKFRRKCSSPRGIFYSDLPRPQTSTNDLRSLISSLMASAQSAAVVFLPESHYAIRHI